jgi:ATP-dependent helicase/nuclease subunit B
MARTVSRPNTIRIIEAGSAAARVDEARRFLAAFPPDAERLIVAASRGAADDLAREVAVASGATWGLHRFSFTQLAARVAAPALAADGVSPGTTLGGEAVAARAAFEATRDEALEYFRPVARMPGFARALSRTLRELRLAGVDAARLTPLGAAGADLARLLERFDEQFALASSADRARLFRAAARTLAAGESNDARMPLVLLDVPIESEAERQFLSALTGLSTSVLVTLPAGDAVTRRAYDAHPASGSIVDTIEEPGSDLGRLRRFLFAEEAPLAEPSPDAVRIFSAPGEARECVELVRRVLQEARDGTRFDRVAILLRSPQQYLGLLEHACARAGVPAYFDRGTRRPDPAGRAFLALLACAGEGLSAKRFAEYLSLAQVPDEAPRDAAPFIGSDEALGILAEAGDRVPAVDDADAAERPFDPDAPVVGGSLRAPWKWEQLIVESAVIGGQERWVRRLDGLAAEYRLKLRALEAEEPDSPRLARVRRDLENLGHLRRFALPVIDTLGGWTTRANWGEWLHRLRALAPRVLRQPARVLHVLADLLPMADIGPAPLEEVRDVLAERLLTLEADPPAHRYGRVFVGSPHQARGRTFDVVFVPGLAERVFPQKSREDPLLLDERRAALDPSLPRRDERTRTERLLLRLAVGAATRRVYLSYPRLDASESRPRVPSFYMLDVMRAITGRVPSAESLGEQAAREGQALLGWPAPPDARDAIDDLEHDLATLAPLLRSADIKAVRGHAHYLLRLNECLRRSVVERWARAERRWSPADGLMRITDATRPALASARLTARAYSLSALQRYAACPYQFLLSSIYRLEPADEPVALQRMDPLTRGSLFHAVQAAFFREMARQDLLPLSPDRLPAALAAVDAALDAVAADYRDELAPAIERVWNDEVADLQKDLRQWVRKTVETDAGWRPSFFEFSFGLARDADHDPRSVPDPVTIDGRFALRGSVDLVERRADGALRVTDHKTGRNRSKRGMVIDGGRVLQPVLYSMVVESALDARVVEGRLSYCTAAGGFTSFPIEISESTRRLGIEALEIVDRAIDQGALAAAPDAGACLYCDFRAVCGPNEERRVRRKAPERLRDLEELRSRP